MNFQQSIALINHFSSAPIKPTACLGKKKLQSLTKESTQAFPKEIADYIENFCPEQTTTIAGVGHPIEVLSLEQLSWQMPGFKHDAITKLPNKAWQNNWFLIAVEGGEPVIVDLNDNFELSPVYSAMQTDQGWDFSQVADSIAQYLFCAKAIEHAMHFPGISEPIDEEFNLVLPIANWLFPLLYTHAQQHYDEWASVFENYLD